MEKSKEIKEKILKIKEYEAQIKKLEYLKDSLEDEVKSFFDEQVEGTNRNIFDDENVKLGIIEKTSKKMNSYKVLSEFPEMVIEGIKSKKLNITLNMMSTLKLLKEQGISNIDDYVDMSITSKFVYDIHENNNEEPF